MSCERRPRAGLAILFLSFALCIGTVSSAGATGNPSVRLEGATVPRAKALALDAALLKGWRLAQSGRDFAVFETRLDSPASPGPADARAGETTLLRIYANFTEANGVVSATLRAEEVWRPFTPRAWATDITEAYRPNLERALASLRRQWDRFLSSAKPNARPSRQPQAGLGIGAGQPRPLDPVTLRPRPSPSAASPSERPQSQSRPGPVAPRIDPDRPAAPAQGFARDLVGICAFDAERVARQRGCDLDDRGAILVSDEAGIELHRIGCLDRPDMLVRCSRQRCWAARR
jgi:hypothetical protein